MDNSVRVSKQQRGSKLRDLELETRGVLSDRLVECLIRFYETVRAEGLSQ